MTDFKSLAFMKAMKQKRDKAKIIKEKFVDSGDADKMLEIIREKRKHSINPEDLPF